VANATDWSTPTPAIVAVAAGGVALVVADATVATDAPGRLIIGIAAIGLLAIATLAGLRRPRLAVSSDESGPVLLVRGARAVKAYRRAEVSRVQLSRTRRVGRSSAMLEIDVLENGTERLLVFSRWDLGTNPHDVVDALTAAGL